MLHYVAHAGGTVDAEFRLTDYVTHKSTLLNNVLSLFRVFCTSGDFIFHKCASLMFDSLHRLEHWLEIGDMMHETISIFWGWKFFSDTSCYSFAVWWIFPRVTRWICGLVQMQNISLADQLLPVVVDPAWDKQRLSVSLWTWTLSLSTHHFNQPGNPNSAAAFKLAHTWLTPVIRAVTLWHCLWGL